MSMVLLIYLSIKSEKGGGSDMPFYHVSMVFIYLYDMVLFVFVVVVVVVVVSVFCANHALFPSE